MQPPESADRRRVTQHTPPSAVAPVFDLAQPVAMLDVRAPSGERTGPRAEAILDADLAPEYLAAPAVVIPGDHHDSNAGFAQVGQCCEDAKRAARNHVPPLEPEV